MKPQSMQAAREGLRLRDLTGTRDRRLFRETLQRLPSGIDLELVVEPVLRQLAGHWRWMFAHDCKHLPAQAIRRVVAELNGSRRLENLFLVSAVDSALDDAAVERDWQQALRALHDLSTDYPWSSRQLRTKLRALAAIPRVVTALQTAVVGAEQAELPMLAVLAIEGSDSSLDALLPQFAADSNLERLEALLVHSNSLRIKALVDQVRDRLARRHRESGAIDTFRRLFGLSPTVKHLKVELFVYARRRAAEAATHVFEWRVNSRETNWWQLSLHQFSDEWETTFGALGPTHGCSFEELPSWLAAQRRRFKLEWLSDQHSFRYSTSLRGKLKRSVLQWILGRLPDQPDR